MMSLAHKTILARHKVNGPFGIADQAAEVTRRKKPTVHTFDELKSLFRYDDEIGCLYWNERPEEHFKNQHFQRIWNTKYAGNRAGSPGRRYDRLTIDGRHYYIHRLVWALHHEYWPKEIDHINGNYLDNHIENLMDVNRSENNRNRCLGRLNKTGIMGVHWDKNRGKWRAAITRDGKVFSLGRFPTIEEAVRARTEAAIKLGFSPLHGRARA